jgi:hypothetical protein
MEITAKGLIEFLKNSSIDLTTNATLRQALINELLILESNETEEEGLMQQSEEEIQRNLAYYKEVLIRNTSSIKLQEEAVDYILKHHKHE